MPDSRPLVLTGVRTHNLQGFSASFPRGSWTSVCGVSGSGKSSLVFHTLHAESERRWLATLPAWRRLLADTLPRPPIESAQGLTPTAALRQEADAPAGTLGGLAGLREPLAALYAAAAVPFSPVTGRPMVAHAPDQVADLVVQQGPGERIQVMFPASGPIKTWIARGFVRARVAGEEQELSAFDPSDEPAGLQVVVDRLRSEPRHLSRLAEAVGVAFRMGGGICLVSARSEAGAEQTRSYSDVPRCEATGRTCPRPTPALFSPHSVHGACPVCTGSGGEDDLACPACAGSGLREESRWFRLGGLSVDEFTSLPVRRSREVVSSEPWNLAAEGPCRELVGEIRSRLEAMEELGLGYLPLGRSARALSEGEERRARLSCLVGAPLAGLTYVLDEPATGLHALDVPKVHRLLGRMRDAGATLVVVEHDLESLQACDKVLEIGPGPGPAGGRLLFEGGARDLVGCDTPTGRWLSGKDRPPDRMERPSRAKAHFEGISGRNLNLPALVLPLDGLVAVTGVSGAGKSSLLQDALAPALARTRGAHAPGLPVESVRLEGPLEEVRVVPAGGEWVRSLRSTVATSSGMLDELRALFASLPEAKANGFGPGRFSPNAKGGRCERCEGLGEERVRLHLLPDAWVVCSRCQGARFEPATLEVRWKGLSIAQILDAPLAEMAPLFQSHPRLGPMLERLVGAGLGHLCAGRRLQGLSGGEALRLRLVAALGSRSRNVLWVLDEPTRGLHPRDAVSLLGVLESLVAQGHGVWFSTHDPFLASRADHLVELGPGAGEEGGRVLYSGAPSGIAATDCPSAAMVARALV